MGINRGNTIIGNTPPDPAETNVQNNSDALFCKGNGPNRRFWVVQDGLKRDLSVSTDKPAGNRLCSSASAMISC